MSCERMAEAVDGYILPYAGKDRRIAENPLG
jgi:hypothetical protein